MSSNSDATSVDSTTNTAETTETTETTIEPQVLTAVEEITGLRNVHEFLKNFDRVPGFLTSQWSQALDTIAVVANSLIAKNDAANAGSQQNADDVAAAANDANTDAAALQ